MFDLSRNPFGLLRVPVDASATGIREAYQERLLDDDVEEQELLQAQQALMAPRRRLEATVRWLPGVLPSIVQRIHESDYGDPTARRLVFDALKGNVVAAANVAAHFCARSGDCRPIVDLIRAHLGLDDESLARALDGAIAEPTGSARNRSMLDELLAGLRSEHLAAAAYALDEAPLNDVTATLIASIAALAGSRRSGAHSLLDGLIRRYALRVEGPAALLEEELFEALEKFRSDPDSRVVFDLSS